MRKTKATHIQIHSQEKRRRSKRDGCEAGARIEQSISNAQAERGTRSSLHLRPIPSLQSQILELAELQSRLPSSASSLTRVFTICFALTIHQNRTAPRRSRVQCAMMTTIPRRLVYKPMLDERSSCILPARRPLTQITVLPKCYGWCAGKYLGRCVAKYLSLG